MSSSDGIATGRSRRTEIWAVGVTRNEADILGVTVRHLLEQGVCRLLILDNGSTDGTDALLAEMSGVAPVEWRPHRGPFQQQQLLTALAREAYVRGAEWVLPFDADEFWCAPGSTIRTVLERTDAGALRVQVVNFVQRRDQAATSPDALLTMTRRTEVPVGAVSEIAALVEAQDIAFVEHRYAPKWIARACASLEIGWGNHTLAGAQPPAADTGEIVCLHAPLRSRAALDQKVDGARPHEDLADYLEQAWHVRRWRRLAAEGRLDDEWKANSYLDDALDLYGTPRPLVVDFRLRDVVAPWLWAPARSWPTLASDRSGHAGGDRGAPEAHDAEDLPTSVRPEGARVWGICTVRNAADVIRTHVLHHLALGFERLLVVDLDSSDDTRQVLAGLTTESRFEWRRSPITVGEAATLTALAREAWSRGASWVVPLEPDEFLWMDGDTTLPSVLEASRAGVVACSILTFIQRREVAECSPQAMLKMTARCAEPWGPYQSAERIVGAGLAPVVGVVRRAKWLCRAAPMLEFDDTGHAISGVVGDVVRSESMVCLHAPLRSRAQLGRLRQRGRTVSEDGLEREWTANTVANGRLGDGSRSVPLLEDDRLQGVFARWMDTGQRAPGMATALPDDLALRRHTLSEGNCAAILEQMRPVAGWLSDVEAKLLMRAVEQALAAPDTASCIVEIGSHIGRSTVVLGSTVLGLGSDAPVYAIDPHLGELGAHDSEVGVTHGASTHTAFLRTLADAGLTEVVRVIRRHSFEVEWTRPIALLFIDGLHDRDSVIADAARFVPSVVNGGFVVFHDYSDLFPGVTEVVNSLIDSGVLRIAQRDDALVVLERTDVPLARWPDAGAAGWSDGDDIDPSDDGPGPCDVSSTGAPTLAQWYRAAAEATDARTASLRHRARSQSQLLTALHRQIDRHRTSLALLSLQAGRPGEDLGRSKALASELVRQLDDARKALAVEQSHRNDLAREADRLRSQLTAKRTDTQRVAQQVASLQTNLDRSTNEVAALRASWSWRVTAPLRWFLGTLLRWQSVFTAALTRQRPRPSSDDGQGQDVSALTPTPGRSGPAGATPGPDRTRVLVISDALPTPDRDSGSYRMVQVLKLLTMVGHDVTFVSDALAGEERYETDLARMGVPVIRGAAAAVDHLEQAGPSYAHVLVCRPDVAFKYLFAVRAFAHHARVAYDTVDVHSVRMRREAEVSGDAGAAAKADMYERVELFNSQSSDLVIAVTEADKRALLARDPALPVAIVPNIHPAARRGGGWEGRRELMFIGNFSHRPNEDAVVYFVNDILPAIRRTLPDVIFHIVGSETTGMVLGLAGPHVRLAGHVDDVASSFDQARVFVAPLRFGAGMKGKIGQSMSHGVPVVTTSVGAEGMMLSNGMHALIADTPDDFARAVVTLYTDRGLWERLAASGAAHIQQHFSDSAVLPVVAGLFPPGAPPAAGDHKPLVEQGAVDAR